MSHVDRHMVATVLANQCLVCYRLFDGCGLMRCTLYSKYLVGWLVSLRTVSCLFRPAVPLYCRYTWWAGCAALLYLCTVGIPGGLAGELEDSVLAVLPCCTSVL